MEGKRTILYVITKGTWGGAQKYVSELAREARSRFAVSVALGGYGLLAERLAESGLRVIPLARLGRDPKPLRDLAALLELGGIIRRERPDILHLNSPKAGFIGALVGRLFGVRQIVYTSHGWPFEEDRMFPARFAFFLLSWLTVILAHRTVVVSERDFALMRRMPFAGRKMLVIHNGVSCDILPERAHGRAILHDYAPEGTGRLFMIGMLAELHKNKGLAYAIEAMRTFAVTLPEARLIIFGEGEERGALERLIVRSGLEGSVKLAGHRSDAARLLLGFDAFLLSSVKEGLPYALLEAGCAGVPIVATKVGGVPEIIDDGETGLLAAPKDAAALAEKILFLARNPKVGKEMARKLKNKIEVEFDRAKMLERTFALYR